MKCPKCHYLSFDPEPRCRNCGYDLELSDDLALKTAEGAVEGPLADLTLRQTEAPRRAPITLELVHPARTAAEAGAAAAGSVDLPARSEMPAPSAPAAVAERAAAPPRPSAASHPDPDRQPDAPRRRQPAPASTPTELPLFVRGLEAQQRAAAAHDNPMIAVPHVPRAPLAVRRAAPETQRPRRKAPQAVVDDSEHFPSELDPDLLDGLRRVEQIARAEAAEIAASAPAPRPRRDDEATMGARLAAAGIDALLLGGIGAVVLFATLRVCGLGIADLTVLPIVPLATFLLLVTVGYLLMFTIASGQTVGKMIMGIRVVGAIADDRGPALSVKQAAYRELLSLPLVIAFGAGYVPAVFGRGQAVHDRLAETRVVRA
jgi:uncharacterized RDD family membrane protein YckC